MVKMSMPVQPSPCEPSKYSFVECRIVSDLDVRFAVELFEHDFVECALKA